MNNFNKINMKKSNDLNEMLLINTKQKNYYESKNDNDLSLNEKGNILTRLWRKARRAQIGIRKAILIDDYIYDQHKKWMGDLKNKDILDLGCYNGNTLSFFMAEKSKSYLGIDLSEIAINDLNTNLKKIDNKNARAEAIDFLSKDFQLNNRYKFDIIYAHSVAHHFKHFDTFLKVCFNCLKEEGVMITFDPLETYIPMYILRKLFRPFQSDKDWEYPFSKKNIKHIKKYFQIIHIQGIMGKVKLAVVLYFFNHRIGAKYGERLFEYDKKHASKEGSALYNCLQISMHLRKKNNSRQCAKIIAEIVGFQSVLMRFEIVTV